MRVALEMRLAPALLACLLTACNAGSNNHDRPAPPPPSASAVAPPAPPAPLVDLFYRTKARVAVTSNVQNPKDYPEHLIDRRPETAWNGKTGDLDARVLFRVPAGTRVRRMLITVGYDRTNKDGDLFFLNHRLKKVSLSREGRIVGTFDLDPENRRPQPIELDEPGGTFELRVVETVPGTKTTWREIVISELVVLGTAPEEELLPPAMPRVTIGSLDRPASESGPLAAVRDAGPYPTIAAFCTRHVEAETKILDRIKASNPGVFVEEMKPYCRREERPAPKIQRLAAPFEEIAVVSLLEAEEMVERLVLRTDRGFFPMPVTFSMEFPGPGCGMSSGYEIDSAVVEPPRKGAPVLVMKVTKRAAYLMGLPNSFEAAAEFFIACTLDKSGAPVCQEELVASFDGNGEWTHGMRDSQRWDAHPPRWDWTRGASVDDEGHIRLGSCVGPMGPLTTCSRRNADLLRRF